MRFIRLACLLAVSCAFALPASDDALRGQEQYPTPLKHTPEDHPADHVVMIDVEGLHERDLDRWISDHPQSALARLSARGDTFTNAWLPTDDPVVSLLALVTAGTPISTGVPATEMYDRRLSPARGDCRTRGTMIRLSGTYDPDDLVVARSPERECAPLRPHDLLRDNTVFDLVQARGDRTAWAGEDVRTSDLLRGREGTGLSEVFVSRRGMSVSAADAERVAAMKLWISGRTATSQRPAPTPVLMGLTLTAFADVQRNTVAYVGGTGELTFRAERVLQHLDRQIREIIDALQARGIFDRTWILITATELLAPADDRLRLHRQTGRITRFLSAAGIPVAGVSPGGSCLLWLQDGTQAPRAAKLLWKSRQRLGIASVRLRRDLAATLYSPSDQSPDLAIDPPQDVLWDATQNHAARTGSAADTRHTAMLVSGAQFTGRSDPTPVPTTQAAALLLRALGLEKLDLEAQHHEHAPALPGVF